MKKLLILIFCLLFIGCVSLPKVDKDIEEATESAGYWSGYTELTETDIAATDDFLVRDISATPPANGTQKRYQWESMKGDMHHALYPRECFTLEEPSTDDIDVPIFSYSQAFTVTEMRCWTEGGTSVTIHLEDQGDNALDSMICDADGTDDDTSIANASFSANEQMEFDITAVDGEVTWLNFCFSWEIDSP